MKTILTKQPVGSQDRLAFGKILDHILLGNEASLIPWCLKSLSTFKTSKHLFIRGSCIALYNSHNLPLQSLGFYRSNSSN